MKKLIILLPFLFGFLQTSFSQCDSYNGSVSGPTNVTVGQHATYSANINCGGGTPYFFNYSITPSTYTVISGSAVSSLTVRFNVSGVYTIRFEQECTGGGELVCSRSLTVNVTCPTIPSPSTVNTSPSSICRGSSSTLSASGCSGTVQWHTNSTGTGTPLSSTTVSPTSTTTYYAFCTVNGCRSSSGRSTTVTVNTIPNAPTSVSASPSTICRGSSSTLSASGCSGTVQWYTNSTGTGTPLSSTTVNPTSTTTYYAFCTVNGCRSSTGRSTTVTVNTIPNAPTSVSASPSTICRGSNSTLSASGCSGTVQWYTNSAGTGTPLSSSTVSPTSTTTYYAFCTVNGCRSSTGRSTIVTVNTIPNAPTSVSASPSTICRGSNSTLSASGCSGTVQWYTNSAGTGTPLSSTTVSPTSTTTYYAFCTVNGCKSSSGRSVVVNVGDNIAPSISCIDTTIYLGQNGMYTIDTSFVVNSYSDNCGVDSIWISKYTFNCNPYDTITVYIDDHSGNMDSCQSIITILDTVSPTALCRDTSVYLNQNGTYTIDSSYINNLSTDNCQISSISLSKYQFNCNDTGIQNITMTVTDIYNNQSSCNANITIIDSLPPQAICQNINAYLDSTGNVKISHSDIDNGSNDNCSLANLYLSDSTFNCNNIGSNTVTLYAIDSHGNIDSCNANVNIIDSTSPKIECIDDISTSFSNNNCEFTIGNYTPLISAFSDNCDDSLSLIFMQTPAAGTLYTIDPNNNPFAIPIRVTLEDNNGNQSECDFNVIVNCLTDVIVPEFISPNGDGKNDKLNIENLEFYTNNSFKVYNRWGNLVYSKSNYDNSFDGKSNTGVSLVVGELPSGTYYYILELIDRNESVTGYLQIQR